MDYKIKYIVKEEKDLEYLKKSYELWLETYNFKTDSKKLFLERIKPDLITIELEKNSKIERIVKKEGHNNESYILELVPGSSYLFVINKTLFRIRDNK